jgi:hypothetical protein
VPQIAVDHDVAVGRCVVVDLSAVPQIAVALHDVAQVVTRAAPNVAPNGVHCVAQTVAADEPAPLAVPREQAPVWPQVAHCAARDYVAPELR